MSEYYNVLDQTTDIDTSVILQDRDPESLQEMDRFLASASPIVNQRSVQLFGQLPQIIMQAQEMLSQFAQAQQPQIPVDPNQAAETQRRAQADAMKAQSEERSDQIKVMELEQDGQIEFAKLSADEREEAIKTAREEAKQAADRAARLEELAAKERAEDERMAAKLESDERRNTQDNLTALTISAAELEAGRQSDLSTGTGINPSGD